MERWTDKKRSYPDGTFPRRTNALSLIASQREELGGIDQTQVTDGEATVKRFGKYEQVYYKPELEVSLTEPGIILSSARNECYLIKFKVNGTSVEVKSKVKKIHLPHTVFFADTFIEPDFGENTEICPFIYTLNYKNFIIVIGETRNDWHFNYCQNLAELSPFGGEFSWYYFSWFPLDIRQSDQYSTDGWGWSYGFSPFSFFQASAYLNRFIDQNKRLYIPILGRGPEFEKAHPKLTGCYNGRFGKKPFTITKDGIVSFKEVVKELTILLSPDGYNMQAYWPFIPYMFEISNLDIQLGKKDTSLWSPAPFYDYKMQYYTKEGKIELSLRTDVIGGSFPIPVYQKTNSIGIVDLVNSNSGNNTVTDTRTQTSSLNLKKYTSIGTIGNLKDLHVVTELVGNMASNLLGISIVDRTSDMPGGWYAAGFFTDEYWTGGPYHDTTNCSFSEVINHSNALTGKQKLMAGDVEIDSGDISMIFSGSENCQKTHNGTTDWVPPPPCTRIAYTTLQMSANEGQTLTAYDINGNICSTNNCKWLMISGVGSVNAATGVYTAPSSNPGCDNPVIGLYCNNILIDSIKIAVNIVTVGDAFRMNILTSVQNGNCGNLNWYPAHFGVLQYTNRVTYKCDGTVSGTVATTCFIDSGGQFDPAHPCSTNASLCELSPVDLRTPTQIAAGCCPAQLL